MKIYGKELSAKRNQLSAEREMNPINEQEKLKADRQNSSVIERNQSKAGRQNRPINEQEKLKADRQNSSVNDDHQRVKKKRTKNKWLIDRKKGNWFKLKNLKDEIKLPKKVPRCHFERYYSLLYEYYKVNKLSAKNVTIRDFSLAAILIFPQLEETRFDGRQFMLKRLTNLKRNDKNAAKKKSTKYLIEEEHDESDHKDESDEQDDESDQQNDKAEQNKDEMETEDKSDSQDESDSEDEFDAQGDNDEAKEDGDKTEIEESESEFEIDMDESKDETDEDEIETTKSFFKNLFKSTKEKSTINENKSGKIQNPKSKVIQLDDLTCVFEDKENESESSKRKSKNSQNEEPNSKRKK